MDNYDNHLGVEENTHDMTYPVTIETAATDLVEEVEPYQDGAVVEEEPKS